MNKQGSNGSTLVSFDTDMKPFTTSRNSTVKRLFIIVDRQEFIRGCLNSWITMFCPEFELANGTDVITALSTEMLARASVVIFSANGATLADGWLNNQVAWLKANCPNLPVVAIVGPDEVRSIADLAHRFRLQGYVPTNSSMEIAAAVLRLVAAGGVYIPQVQETNPLPLAVNTETRTSEAVRAARLTPRECMVLNLLGRGMSNKIIAYRLSLSQSTIKAHVHNIISKLKVHNRTEAAVVAHRVQSRTAVEHEAVSIGPILSASRRETTVPTVHEITAVSSTPQELELGAAAMLGPVSA